MDYIPKELEENQLRLEVAIDPDTKCMTMKTHLDDKSESGNYITTEVLKDPLLQPKTDEVDLEKMSDLDQLIYLERQRLLNIKLPKKSEKFCRNKDLDEPGSNHHLTQNEKSRLRMQKLRQKESIEEHEYRKFRGRVHTMKTRLLQKLRNFEDETYLKEVNRRACDRVKQKRLELKANETPTQEALRKKRVNLARRRLLLRNKVFSTPEDILREKDRRTKYLERAWSRCSEEQRIAKRRHATEKAKERRKENRKEWKAIQKAVKGEVTEDVKVASVLKDSI